VSRVVVKLTGFCAVTGAFVAGDGAGLFTRADLVSLPAVAIAAVVVTFVGTLLALHVDRRSAAIARSIVRRAAKQLPAAERAAHEAEWVDHVESAGEHGLTPLTRALSIALIAAPSLAVGLRVGRHRTAAVTATPRDE
jgi:hypothetical protein